MEETKMEIEMCKSPCSECPFRRDAMRGHVGNYESVDEFYSTHVQADTLNPCHMTMEEYQNPNWDDKFKKGELGKSCAGQAVFYKNMCKIDRNGQISTKVKQDHENVFSWPHEFLEYHDVTRKNK